MEQAHSARPLARQACVACKSKKRKCDKTLPACSRCRRVSQQCQYIIPNDHVHKEASQPTEVAWRFKHVNIRPETMPLDPSLEFTESNAACKRCREGKRQCSKGLPRCTRCVRAGVPCVYDLSSLRPRSVPLSEKFAEPYIKEEDDAYVQSLLTIDPSGHAHLDPFQTYPSSLPPDCISKILTYSVKEMWPKLFPGYVYKGSSFVDHWMRSAMDSPPLFNAWLHSGAEHMQLREQASGKECTSGERDPYTMLLIEREAILGLKQFVENGSPEQVTDEIVMSALALALHPPERKRSAALRMSSAPLSNLQWLSRFTDIVVSEGHVRGLRHLVELRGGFDSLEMPGLKQGLSSFNLVVASKYLERPFWPLRTHLQFDDITKYLATFQPRKFTADETLPARLSAVIPHSMNWEFSSICRYSILLDSYARGMLPDLDMGYVLEIRNIIHYRTMSLPPATEIAAGSQDLFPVYEACRLGLTAYSLLVIFPVPVLTEPYPQLAHLLRSELEMTVMNLDIWMPASELLLWVLMMGGIASLGTMDRSWYAYQLRWLVGIMGIETWEQLKAIMTAIMWLDNPCDTEGMLLWDEVQELGQFPSEVESILAFSDAGSHCSL